MDDLQRAVNGICALIGVGLVLLGVIITAMQYGTGEWSGALLIIVGMLCAGFACQNVKKKDGEE
jgi:hypothetical protein